MSFSMPWEASNAQHSNYEERGTTMTVDLTIQSLAGAGDTVTRLSGYVTLTPMQSSG
ncbi:hypothetical protein BH23CHL1_BH23CHL1_12360 [soil metagenome]